MTLPKTWSSFIWTWPTATPRHRTFLSWNLMVERTSVILLLRSSAWATGVGNLPAVGGYKKGKIGNAKPKRTLGQTGSQQTGNLLDQRLRGEESVVFLGELLDQLLVLVQSNTDDDEHLIVLFERTRKEKNKRTSSNRPQTCTRAQSAWPDRCQQHRRECRSTSGDGGHWGV